MRDNDDVKTDKTLPQQALEAFDYHTKRWALIDGRSDDCMKCLSKDGPWPILERQARETKGQERPCIHEDVLTQYVNQVINEAQANPIGIEVSPDGDGATPETANFAEDRIRQSDYVSNAVHAHVSALESAVMQGIGVWEIGTDWEKPPFGSLDNIKDLSVLFRQKITTIAATDRRTYVLDSDAIKPDWSDQREAFKISRMPHDEFRRRFKKAQITDFTGLMNSSNAKWLDEHTVQVAEWWRIEPEYRMVLRLEDGSPMGIAIFEDQMPAELLKTAKVLDKRDVEICKVIKRLTNGIEILDEMEWPDYEIPILVTTGRVKYEEGVRIIDSLIYAAIPGQLLHDYTVSAIQEETNRAIKVKAWGPEGTFDTNTNWVMLHREPTAYAEWKVVYDKNGNALPPPELITNAPNIAALLEAKQSNLIDIQNMLGMSSTERMDRTAKSGKALESLDETKRISTYHFTNSWKMAKERDGRIKERLLNQVDAKSGKVSLRDAKGDHRMEDVPEGVYSGRHTVVISAGENYKSQQQKTEQILESIVKSGDPSLQMAAMPNLIRILMPDAMGEELASELEAIQPAPMQQARMQAKKGKEDPNAAIQAARMAQQQAQQFQMIAQELKAEVDKLTHEKQAKTVEMESRERMNADNNKTTKYVSLVNASVKENITALETAMNRISQDLERQSQQEELVQSQQHEQGMQSQGQQHEAEMTAANQMHDAASQDAEHAHQEGMQGQQLDAAAQQAAMAAEQQAQQGAQ